MDPFAHGSGAIDGVCQQITRFVRAHDRATAGLAAGAVDLATVTEIAGVIEGLRVALCVMNGWDPIHDSDQEGPADQLWRRSAPGVAYFEQADEEG